MGSTGKQDKNDFYIKNDSEQLKDLFKRIAKQKGFTYGPYARSLIIKHVEENKHILPSKELEDN